VSDLGRLLVIAGLMLVGLGTLLWLGAKIPWLGKLPGDLTWQRGRFTLYVPLVTCLLISLLLTLLLNLFRK